MIDALQQIINQLAALSPEEQAVLADEIQHVLSERQRKQAEQARVSQMSADEFAAFLAERKVSKPYLAPGYRGSYYSTEEFDEALESWAGPEAVELYQHEKNAADANI